MTAVKIDPADTATNESLAGAPSRCPAPDVLAELEHLALGENDTGVRAVALFGRLRKAQGSERLAELATGIRHLAATGRPEGTRLLASYLDLATLAERLLPWVRNLTSSRRFFLLLHADRRGANPFARAWVGRLLALSREVREEAGVEPQAPAEGAEAPVRGPGREHPWGLLRDWFDQAWHALERGGAETTPGARRLRELLRLEVDALEERSSRLAGAVDPFRVAAIRRLLPILSGLDAGIRDLRGLIGLLEAGRHDEVIRRPRSRALEAMDPVEFDRFESRLCGDESTAALGRLLALRSASGLPLRQMCDDVLRLQRFGQMLARGGEGLGCEDPLGAVAVAVEHGGPDGLRWTLPERAARRLEGLLEDPDRIDETLRGARIETDGRTLFLPRRADGEVRAAWPNGLPICRDGQVVDVDVEAPPAAAVPAAPGEPTPDMGASEVKRLVMNSMQTTSILLALLRNPKVTSVPGLVAEVANRTRNPQIISTIASDRTLHSGFANRDVPLACLRNPSNVSVKVLRKFIHVKFVSKIDLKRLAQDRAGVRRELRSEIDRYLEALA